MLARSEYRDFCKQQLDMPFYNTADWLDTVAENQWNVALLKNKGGEIYATFPYVINKGKGLSILTKPLLTPYVDLWIIYPKDQKYAQRLSFKKQVVEKILEKLPQCAYHKLFLPPGHDNVHPFLWAGFSQVIAYTHILVDLSDLNLVFNNFRRNIKKHIRKAESQLKILEGQNIDLFFKTNALSFKRQGINPPYEYKLFQKIDKYFLKDNKRKILFAENNEGVTVATQYLVFDQGTVYAFAAGTNPQYKSSGASSLLLWEAIKYASESSMQFNFLGSNIKAIEKFVSGFGGKKTPYFSLFKAKNKFYKMLYTLLKE